MQRAPRARHIRGGLPALLPSILRNDDLGQADTIALEVVHPKSAHA